MGVSSRKQRRTDRMLEVIRAEAGATRALSVDDRTALTRFRTAALGAGVAGLLWPVTLSVFAVIRGDITHPPVRSSGKYRYADVATGWPDFTAPWPVPVVLLIALVTVTAVLLIRHRHLTAHVMGVLAFAWLAAGAGITCVGFMYLGADRWPHWQAGLGIPTLVVGGVLWILNRRREDQLLRTAARARRRP
jgi:heme/copper-type cytochrome/quinol oxidase subunit 4